MEPDCIVEFIFESIGSYLSSPDFFPFDLVCSCELKCLDSYGCVSYLSSLSRLVIDGGYICSNDSVVSRDSVIVDKAIPIKPVCDDYDFENLLNSSINFNQDDKECMEQKHSIFKKTKDGLKPVDCYILTCSSLWSKSCDADELLSHSMLKYTHSGGRILSLFNPSDAVLDLCMSCHRMFYCFCDKGALYNKADV